LLIMVNYDLCIRKITTQFGEMSRQKRDDDVLGFDAV
jgi:hypothetical protein